RSRGSWRGSSARTVPMGNASSLPRLARKPQPFTLIGAAGNAVDPQAVRQIPRDGRREPLFECPKRLPAEFPANLAGIDRVAPIVARPIGHKIDERLAGKMGQIGA